MTAENLRDSLRDALYSKRAELKLVSESIDSKRREIKSVEDRLLILDEANKFLAGMVSDRVLSVKDRLESLTNQGLEYIFGSSKVRVSIESEFKNNKTIFSLRIRKQGVDTDGVVESFGGGLLSVIAFILKIVAVVLVENRRFLILDESLSMLSDEYQEPMSKFIATLCKELDFTIVLIAHQPKLSTYADVCYEAYVCDRDKSTKFKEIER